MKKNTIVLGILFMLLSGSSFAQLGDNSTYAFERTAYERWDEFKPGYLFWEFLGIKIGPLARYDDEDRRTMYQRARMMTEWSLYKDHYQAYQRQNDSMYTAENYKMIDRKANKSWWLTQKIVFDKYSTSIDISIEESVSIIKDQKIITGIKRMYGNILEKITLVLDSNETDYKKEKYIEERIKELKQLSIIIIMLNEYYKTVIDEENILLNTDEIYQILDDDIQQIFPIDIKMNKDEEN